MAPPARISPIPTQIVDAFRVVAPAIEAFARKHDVLIERYRRAKPSWELRFARRVGGQAVLTISYRERTGHVLDVSATWWLDDRAAQTRRLRSEKIGVYDRRAPSAVLVQQLEAGLAMVDQWTLSDLGPPRGPFPASAAPGVERAARSAAPGVERAARSAAPGVERAARSAAPGVERAARLSLR